MNERIGFRLCRVLLEAENTCELNEAMRIVNNMYPILLEHLEVLEGCRDGRFEMLIGRVKV